MNYPDHSPESENYGFTGEGVSRSSTDSETASRLAGQTTPEERGAGETGPGIQWAYTWTNRRRKMIESEDLMI
jgi:hypothetical protein